MFGEDAGRMKLTCSELLTVYKVVRHFVETKCRDPRVSNEVRVFDIACEMVGIIVQLKANHIPVDEAHGRFAALEKLLLPAFGAAHGGDWTKPKIHWALHFSGLIKRPRCVVDQFVIERLHHDNKAAAQTIQNVTTLETTMMEAWVQEICRFASHRFGFHGRVFACGCGFCFSECPWCIGGKGIEAWWH